MRRQKGEYIWNLVFVSKKTILNWLNVQYRYQSLEIRVWGGVEFNVLLHTTYEQKVIGNWFCAPIIFKYPLKKRFFDKQFWHKKQLLDFWIEKIYFFKLMLLFTHFLKITKYSIWWNKFTLLNFGSHTPFKES